MKSDKRSSQNYRWTCLFALLLLLQGCADTPWPTWFSGEPDPSVLAASRNVARPEGFAKQTYPSLRSVPTARPIVADPLDFKDDQEDLQSERLQGQAAGAALGSVAIPEPLGGAEAERPVIEEAVPAPVLVAPQAMTEDLPAPPLPEKRPFSALLP